MLAVTTRSPVKAGAKPQLAPLHHGQLRRRAKAGERGRVVIAAGIIPAGWR
jgi:hypothetical protein